MALVKFDVSLYTIITDQHRTAKNLCFTPILVYTHKMLNDIIIIHYLKLIK